MPAPTPSRRRRMWSRLGLAVGVASLWLLISLVMISQAQTNGTAQLYINQVGNISPDDPRAVITMTVIGPDRLPLETLSQVWIDEMGLPLNNPEVVRVDDGPLRLVLAFDRSYDSDSDWRAAIDAAQTVIDSLRPGDELSIIRFQNEVESEIIKVDPATSIHLATDSRFARGGNRTAFYQAVLAATQHLPNPHPTWQGRQAIIVITNIGENTDSAAAEAARQAILTQLTSMTAPVHVFSFSSKAKNNEVQFSEVAQATGGSRPTYFKEANQLAQPLYDHIARLRWRYQLTFDPSYNPSSSKHPVTVGVFDGTTPLVTATTSYTFNAYQPQLELSWPKWAYLNDPIEITAAVQMPFPVTSVSYQVSGEPSHLEEAPPYRFHWTASQLGSVTISAQAIDRENNVSQPVTITLTVIHPPGPEVQVRLPFDRSLYLPVETGPVAIDRVEIYLDNGQFITTTTHSPFNIWLRPGTPGYPAEPGLQTFQVRIIDQSQRLIREETITVDFTRPALIPNWVWPVASTGLMLLANFLILPFLLAVWRDNYYAELLKRRAARKFWLKNRGNVPTQFLIEVTGNVSDTLAFNLRQRLASSPTTVTMPSHEAAPRTQPPAEQPAASSTPSNRLAQRDGQWQTGQQVNQIAGSGSAVMSSARQYYSIPGVGPILSRSAQTIRQWLTPWRNRVAGFTPVQARLRRFSNLFRSDASTPEIKESPAIDQKELSEPPVLPTTTPEPQPLAAPPLPPTETGWQSRPTLKTGLVAPGETLYFYLELQPAHLDEQQNELGFEIRSRSLEVSAGISPPPLTHIVSFEPRAWIYRYLNLLALMVILAVITVDIVWAYILYWVYLA